MSETNTRADAGACRAARRGGALLLAATTASGFAGLVYEVLWLRQLRTLFGGTAEAAAFTLAVFFGGLALGAAWIAPRAERTRDPLGLYARIELGIALSALPVLGLLPLYRRLYAPLHDLLGQAPVALGAAKVVLAAIALLPPSTLLGATVPAVAEAWLRTRRDIAARGAVLYGVNTVGGAIGAATAALALWPRLGLYGAYAVAVALNVAVALGSWLGRRWLPAGEAPAGPAPEHARAMPGAARPALAFAFASGALALALEVLWTRMFAQVLHNSVYTFGVLLAVFLLALATGAALVGLLPRADVVWRHPRRALFALTVLAAALVPVSGWAFVARTDRFEMLGQGGPFGQYIASTIGEAALVMFVPGLAVGMVFPLSLKLAERLGWSPGRVGKK